MLAVTGNKESNELLIVYQATLMPTKAILYNYGMVLEVFPKSTQEFIDRILFISQAHSLIDCQTRMK